MDYKFHSMTDYDKIMYVVVDMGANCPEKAVTMMQMIRHAIELGMIDDYFTEEWHGYEEGDHPWWQKVAPMMGVGTREEVLMHNEPHLHRKQVEDVTEKSGRKTHVMKYWYDEGFEHDLHIIEKKNESFEEVVKRITKAKVLDIQDCTDKKMVETTKTFLNKKNIPFILETKNGHNVLTVNVVNDRFYHIPLKSETLDQTIGLIPYCILRPDCAKEAIPGLQIAKNKLLANNWKKLTAAK